jgi:hypothetical protein
MGHVLDWQGLDASGEASFDGVVVAGSVVSLGWPFTTIGNLVDQEIPRR